MYVCKSVTVKLKPQVFFCVRVKQGASTCDSLSNVQNERREAHGAVRRPAGVPQAGLWPVRRQLPAFRLPALLPARAAPAGQRLAPEGR